MASTSRVLSNIWIREAAANISGQVLSIGSGTDEDGQGNYYRSYFSKCRQYLTSEVSSASACDLVLDVQNMFTIDDAYFDCVFCSGVLEHVPEPDAALGEITRILKAGGYLLLGVPFRQAIHLPPTDYWRFTEYGVGHLLRKHGYSIEAVKAIDAEDPLFPASYWIKAKKIMAPGLKAVTGYGCISTFFDQRQVFDSQHYIEKMSSFDAEFRAFIHQKEIFDVRKWEYCALLEAFKENFSGKRILDVGCGRSLFSGFLSTLGAQVVTLDLPSPFQEQEAAIAKRRMFGVEHVNGSMLDIPFETGTFDLVISISAIEHLQEVPSNRLQSRSYDEFIEETIQAVKEMARVVKPGGHLFITSDLYDPLRQQTDNWRPGVGVTCAYRLADFERTFSTPLRRAGFFFDRPFSYDFQQLMDDEERATYRGRYFTTFTCLMKKQSDGISLKDEGGRLDRVAHVPPIPPPKPLAEFLPGQWINVVIADEGWILEQCAQVIKQHTEGIKISRSPDPCAAINYYINYSAYQGPQPGINIAFFTHVEERVPSAAERFFQVAREVDVCVCMSTLYAEMLQAQGIDNVHVIKPGVNLELFRPVVRIGVVGRTYPTGRKGEALLKQVMDEPGIEWHFTGEGWPGPCERYAAEQMPQFYNAMDYILVPSYYEGGPMSVLEALACGKEVIAPAVGFVPDYPHIEYATGDAEDLRRVLKLLVAKRFSLRNSVIACSWQNWAEQHRALFHDVLTEKRNAVGCGTDSLRVLLVMHAIESSHQGGPSIRLGKTKEALERLGVSVDVTSQDRPNVSGYDLVHVFNVWNPETALAKLRYFKQYHVPVVFSPIYLDLAETAWAFKVIPVLFDQARSVEELQLFLDAAERGELSVEGMTRYGNNEIIPGYFNQVREMIRLCDHLILLSTHERNCLTKLGAQLSSWTLVRNAADNEPFTGVTGDLFASAYGVSDYILCVGRIERRKNQLMLLQALRGTDIPIVLIGHSVEKDYEELVRRHAGNNVKIIGPLPHDSRMLASAYAGARVFVLPSWSEGAPLAALEAAAAGLSLVLSDRSSEKEYFGELARYCDPGSSASIRTAVIAAYNAYERELPIRRRLLEKVRAEYSWDSVATHTLRAYRTVLQQAGSEKRTSEDSESQHTPPPKQPRKLEIGSGMNPHPGYEHMDIRADLPHIEHVHDIYKPLPFAADTFDEILSWSVVEHISWRNIREVLTNWKKVLKPGGKLEIWVPDLEYLCTMYKEGKVDEHLDKSYIDTAQKVIGHYSPSVWAMIKMFGGQDYQENFHAAMYDWTTMQQMLKSIGFQKVERIAPYHGLRVIAFKPQIA